MSGTKTSDGDTAAAVDDTAADADGDTGDCPSSFPIEEEGEWGRENCYDVD
jgi:hypothetical protein